jgi:cell division protease FtsH
MAADLPPASNNLPVIQQNPYGQPTDVRYSDFLKLVTANRIEKVTFSADGSQLLGVDVDGARVKIEALPNDPSLLTELTSHKVRTLNRSNGNKDNLAKFIPRLHHFAIKFSLLVD